MFNLFDEDGNGTISIEELLNMMAFFIEVGMDTGNVDMAKTMAEVFQKGDANKDDKLNKKEFINVSNELKDKVDRNDMFLFREWLSILLLPSCWLSRLLMVFLKLSN